MASAVPAHPGPLPERAPSYTFTATHFIAGNSSFSQQLFYGVSEALSPPAAHSERPHSTITFDMLARKVVIEIYCDRCAPHRVGSTGVRDGTSKSSMWPFRAEIPWEDLQTRGMRLDQADAHADDDAFMIYNLRINLRRPPLLWYTYPQHLQQRNQRSYDGGPRRVYDRRATEEDYIAIDAGARWGDERDPNGDGRKMTVLGLPTSVAYFKPGNWLSYQISLKLDKRDVAVLEEVLRDLRLTSPYPASYADAASADIPDSMPLPPNPQALLSSIVRYPFPLRYLFEGLISYGIVAPEDLTFLTTELSRAPGESQQQREKLLASLFSMGKISGRIPPVIEELRKKLAASAPAKPPRPHVVLVRRAIVTPTRILLRPPAEETSNHVLREHVDQVDRFLRVQFADENDTIHFKPIWDDTGRQRYANRPESDKWCPGYGMIGRMRRVMDEGLKFAGRNWVYLAAGGSQLKERQAWFICEDPASGFTAQKLRDWMGDFTKEKSIAKHCARISQSFSTTREVKVKLAIKREPDIQRGQFIFTDGVGRTSQALVSKAAQVLHGDAAVLSKFSAVQIRIGGAKGMLAAWPDISKNEVVLRDSMVKYETAHQKFGAVMVANYSPAFLNRQAILLMDALGTDQTALLSAFEKQLSQVQGLHERASSPRKVLEFEMTHFPIQKLFAAGLGSEAFVRDTVMLLQTIMLWDLKWKARIKLEKGVYLFGVADELGVLEEDEVFCSYADPFNMDQAGVVEGDCIITRAPALHPGDIRRVKAVRHPKLIEAGLVNVIIFPTKGKRDLANKLAGGDLDGDTFTLVWDPDLLIAKNEAPSDYSAPTKPRLVDRVQLTHIKEWFIDYFRNDVLGHISNAHMTIADQFGPRCDACIKLAHLASDAVDFQKTGIPVTMPHELRRLARRRPDFMGGAWRPEDSYESNGILGKMFRMVEREPSFERHTENNVHPVLGTLKVPDSYLVRAWKMKLEYELDVVGFMRQYMLSEIEVVTGLVAGVAVAPERRKNMMKDDALKLSIRDAFQVKLLEVYQREVSEWAEGKPVPPTFHSAVECFAVAAYQLVHDSAARERVEFLEDEVTVVGGESQRLDVDGSPSEDLFSFCWLWADELADAVFRRAQQSDTAAAEQAHTSKRKRPASIEGGENTEESEDEPSAAGFAPIPARWLKQRKKARTREGGGWVNIDDDDDMEDDGDEAVSDAGAAGPTAYAVDDDDDDEDDEVDEPPDVIELSDSDDEDDGYPTAPVGSSRAEASRVDDDRSDPGHDGDEAAEPPSPPPSEPVWINIDDSDDEDGEASPQPAPAARDSATTVDERASGITRVNLADDVARAADVDESDEDEIYRQSDWRSPVPLSRPAVAAAATSPAPEAAAASDEPYLPDSPPADAAPPPLPELRAASPIDNLTSDDEHDARQPQLYDGRAVELNESDEEMYGDGAEIDGGGGVWVNDEETDEDEP